MQTEAIFSIFLLFFQGFYLVLRHCSLLNKLFDGCGFPLSGIEWFSFSCFSKKKSKPILYKANIIYYNYINIYILFFRTFALLERLLTVPSKLSEQMIFQIDEPTKHMLIEK